MTFVRIHFTQDLFYTPTYKANLWSMIFFLSSFVNFNHLYRGIPESAIDKGVILSMSQEGALSVPVMPFISSLELFPWKCMKTST